MRRSQPTFVAGKDDNDLKIRHTGSAENNDSLGAASINARNGGQRRQRRSGKIKAVIGGLTFLLIFYWWFIIVGHIGENAGDLSVQETHPSTTTTSSASNETSSKTRTTSSLVAAAETSKNCDELSIYPPRLSQLQNQTSFITTKNKLCGHIFYPMEFAKRVVDDGDHYQDYWKKTGFDYYATGIGLHHVTFDYDGRDATTSNSHNLIYNSMMKCGSTSINRALKELRQASQEYFSFQQPEMNVVYQGKQNNLMVPPSKLLMKNLYEYQQQQSIFPSKSYSTYQYFTTIRDPVKRFVSAIAQEMYVHHGGNKNKDPKAYNFRSKCLLETPQQTLGCSINHVQHAMSTQSLNQPHFIPMTTVLLKRSYGFNVSVLLFDIFDVNSIVSKMVAPSRQLEFSSHKNKLKAQGSAVLKNMTTADLTPEMINQICHLYKVDVQMMHSVGFRTMC